MKSPGLNILIIVPKDTAVVLDSAHYAHLVFGHCQPVLCTVRPCLTEQVMIYFAFCRLFGNSRSADLWSPCLPSRENQTVPAADEGTHLCSGLHCRRHHFWSLRHSYETQAMKTDQSCTTTWHLATSNLELD